MRYFHAPCSTQTNAPAQAFNIGLSGLTFVTLFTPFLSVMMHSSHGQCVIVVVLVLVVVGTNKNCSHVVVFCPVVVVAVAVVGQEDQ